METFKLTRIVQIILIILFIIVLVGIMVGANLNNKAMASTNEPVCINCGKKEYMQFLEADLKTHSFICIGCTNNDGKNIVTVSAHQGGEANGGYCEICDYLYTRELPNCSECGLDSYMSLKYILNGKHIFQCSKCMEFARDNGYENEYGCTETLCEIDKSVSYDYCEKIDSYQHIAHYHCKYPGNCESKYEIVENHNYKDGKCIDCNASIKEVIVVRITE